jgi:hypothetical protein
LLLLLSLRGREALRDAAPRVSFFAQWLFLDRNGCVCSPFVLVCSLSPRRDASGNGTRGEQRRSPKTSFDPPTSFFGRHPPSWSWRTLFKLPSMMKSPVRQTEKPGARRLALCAADYEAVAGQGAEPSIRTKAVTTGFLASYGGRRLQPNCCRGQRESAGHCDAMGHSRPKSSCKLRWKRSNSGQWFSRSIPEGDSRAIVIHMPASLRRRSGPRDFFTLN